MDAEALGQLKATTEELSLPSLEEASKALAEAERNFKASSGVVSSAREAHSAALDAYHEASMVFDRVTRALVEQHL